ncbi:MAG: BrnT family toxin [Candidatus Omnitrophota bacterium]
MLYSKQVNEGQTSFIWDLSRESANIRKHGIDFNTAAKAFKDSKRKIYIDAKHSLKEERLFCIGKVEKKIVTVRFIYRDDKIRIFGAGYWRKGKACYEKND